MITALISLISWGYVSLLRKPGIKLNEFVEVTDLDYNNYQERITVENRYMKKSKEYWSFITIDELVKAQTEESLFNDGEIMYANAFYQPPRFWLKLPRPPENIAFKDVNGDYYKDILFYSRKNNTLEVFVSLQDRKGRFKEVQKIDIGVHPYYKK